ncbi:MAG: serine--tRNA ligase [Nitrospinota bacterium]
MLDVRLIREKREEVARALTRRGESYDVQGVFSLDERRRSLLHEAESLKHRVRELSKEIGARKRRGEEGAELQALMEESAACGRRGKELEGEVREVEERLRDSLLFLPNLPHATTPDGAGPEENVEVRRWGEPPEFDFEPRSHDELGEALGILDFKRAAKLAGARFALYRGAGALLERALISFMLDLHTRERGYTEWLTPFMVSPECMEGTGQLPKFKADLFSVDGDQFFLVPTAEVPVTNIHRGEILGGRELPLRYTAYTPCFRSEAGSYGQDTRGLIRQHQFNKVELVRFAAPETSYAELEALTEDAEEVLKRLGIPYRVVTLCAGDLGFAAAKTYDLEAWVPSQRTFREISSCSNFEDYQARRANIRFRREPGARPEFVHTLNGSGLAVGRTVVALLENLQQADGSVIIPEALRPYMGGMKRIGPGTAVPR